jgi:anti-sigma factor ChrR (cupin superfamily)
METKLNADFAERVVIDTNALPWVPSPAAGVERRMLDRVGGEVARATSIVRYAPASRFPTHRHDEGEEFLVLDGVFSDARGDYPAGAYVRNPPGSDHAPWTETGCVIFVKLRQMPATETARVVATERDGDWQALDSRGARRKLLYASPQASEVVALEELPPGYEGPDEICPGGEELLVLAGALEDERGRYGVGTWIRNPAGFRRRLRAPAGVRYWVKRGHLPPRP